MKSSVSSSSFLDKEISVVVDRSSSSSSLSNVTATTTLQRNTKSCSSLVNQRKQKKSLKDIYIDERKREEEEQQRKAASRGGLIGSILNKQQQQQHISLSIPPVTPIVDQIDSCSIDSDVIGSSSKRTKKRLWGSSSGSNIIYTPQAFIESSIIYYIGFLLFIIAYIWPPLLLVVCFVIQKLISHCFRDNDFGIQRRQLFQQFITEGYDTLPKSYQQLIDSETSSASNSANRSPVQIVHGYWKNSRGMQLHTITMTPASGTDIKAVACFCHGYSDNFSYTKLADYQRLVIQGNIAIVAIEYEGHGLSDGLLAFIEDFTTVIDDVSLYFSFVLQNNSMFQNKAAFLIGESMGGAIAYDVQSRIPNLITGVVLVCPMCKISDEMLPSPIVIDCLKRLLELMPFIGYLPLSPSKQNLDNVTYKVRSKYIEASMSPLNYNHPMRLTTARELLDATQRISETLYDFDTSFLIIHGGADVVTDPIMSQQLYEESKSIDKTIKIYDTMWHAITSGETDTDIDLVFNDIIQWIHQRIPTTTK